MVDLPGDITKMVFRQMVKNHVKTISIDSRLLGVFLQLDGKRNVGVVAQKTRLNLGAMRAAISDLLEMEIIEQVDKNEYNVDKEFLNYLNNQFSKAVGPIADVLIEEEIADMGYQLSNFPISRVPELVDLLAREIRRDEKRSIFKLNMVSKMKARGY
jgi:hypothetical protein